MMQAAAEAILQNHWASLAAMTPVERMVINMLGGLVMVFTIAIRPEIQRGHGLLMWLWYRLLGAIDHDSPRLVEMLISLLEFAVGIFFALRGWQQPQGLLFRVLLYNAPLMVWIVGAFACAGLHGVALWRDSPTWRVYACSASLFCWTMFGRTFAPFGFGFPEAVSYPVAFFSLVCGAALIRQHRRDDGSLD